MTAQEKCESEYVAVLKFQPISLMFSTHSIEKQLSQQLNSKRDIPLTQY